MTSFLRAARKDDILLLVKSRLKLAYINLDASTEGQPFYESLGSALTSTHHSSMRL